MTAVETGTGRHSIAFPKDWWYPACRSSELGRAPRSITLMERPIVVFRDHGGHAHALVDRCAHRNAPLSLGKVASDGCIECPYHGWRYDGQGQCRAVPGLLSADRAPSRTRDVGSYAVREQDGFVWLWGEQGAEPGRDPFPMPVLRGRGAGEIVFPCDLDSTLHAALENTLDVPHTAFLHRGIFRGAKTKELHAIRRDLPDGCEVEFAGESVGLGRFQGGPLAGKVFEHWDRFFVPNVAQVEYRVEDWLRIFNTVVHLPLSPFRTRAWFVLQWSSPVPAALLRPIVRARGRKVLHQDASMLAAQSERIERFGGEQFSSTELDLLGGAIWRLLRRAERGERAPADGISTSETDGTESPAEVVFRA